MPTVLLKGGDFNNKVKETDTLENIIKFNKPNFFGFSSISGTQCLYKKTDNFDNEGHHVYRFYGYESGRDITYCFSKGMKLAFGEKTYVIEDIRKECQAIIDGSYKKIPELALLKSVTWKDKLMETSLLNDLIRDKIFKVVE